MASNAQGSNHNEKCGPTTVEFAKSQVDRKNFMLGEGESHEANRFAISNSNGNHGPDAACGWLGVGLNMAVV